MRQINLLYFWSRLKLLISTMSNFLISFWSYLKLLISTISNLFQICCFNRTITNHIKQFPLELLYFVSISTLGFLILKGMNPRTEFNPRNIDLFFTSVSATTVSSMSTVEMEAFSNHQLIVMIFLMFLGGEVFFSMMGLYIRSYKIKTTYQCDNRVTTISSNSSFSSLPDLEGEQIELGIIGLPQAFAPRVINPNIAALGSSYHLMLADSIKFLGFVLLGYLLVFHILGISLVLLVTNLVSSAKHLLKEKGISQLTFAIFTIVSTFTNCGFIPTNENMIVFSKNSGLLLILIPQVLFGNTLFPSCLRFCLWIMAKYFNKLEAQYLLQNTKEIKFYHLLPRLHSWLLVATVLGFLMIQFVLFCSLEWDSAGLNGLNNFQKFVGVLFQCVNSRHTGESIVDLSTVAPAILVLFVVMMYLPPYTTFLPVNAEYNTQQNSEQRNQTRFTDNILFSPLSYLVIFVILICITERKKLGDDPLNFSILSITLEVVSAYGNVGFSLGYSCERQLKADPTCVNKWYGFSGKWSDEGKLILILVMIYGRLKKHGINRGKAWKLL